MQQYLNLPNFSTIKISRINQQLDEQLAIARAKIERLEVLKAPNWENFAQVIQSIDMSLEDFFSPVSHLNAVANSEELREQYQQAIAKLTIFSSECGQSSKLYKQYQQLQEKKLSRSQKQWVDKALLNFTLSGIALPPEQQTRFKEIKERLSECGQVFSNNVLDATEKYNLNLQSIDALAGIPEPMLELFAQRAKDKSLEGYCIGLDFPSYHGVSTYCENRKLREKLYLAYQCKASDMGKFSMDDDCQFDNSDVMLEILNLRQDMATLLNFENYAQLSLATKMAESIDEVISFLVDLSDKAKPFAEKELDVLKQFAKNEIGLNELEAWDVAFVSEKFRQKHFSLNDEEIRKYFPLEKVLTGLFEITAELFDLSFEEKEINTYHDDVCFYEIKRQGKIIAGFYFDLFSREKKRGGAWMADCRSRWQIAENEEQLPVALLSCNFRPASKDKQALLSHNEVTTLFHEFGHGLHHMLTTENIAGISGIAGVEWDAVELPSQFLENWCWQKESLMKITEHFESKEALPDELLENMLGAKNFNAGVMMLRQVEFALFDMLLHCLKHVDNTDQVQDLLDQVREKTSVLQAPLEVRFQHGFSHIFSGGYAAGYFSYKWAEVLSADCFAAFEEKGIFDKATGQSFLENILQVGSSRSAAESFKAFRGREPMVDPLLRHSGLQEVS